MDQFQAHGVVHGPRSTFCIRPNLACWIISLLLDVLLCSMAEIFERCLSFDSYRLVKLQHNS